LHYLTQKNRKHAICYHNSSICGERCKVILVHDTDQGNEIDSIINISTKLSVKTKNNLKDILVLHEVEAHEVLEGREGEFGKKILESMLIIPSILQLERDADLERQE
jgi:hypothetical protein